MSEFDAAFPRLHGRPPIGWLNDPNGCSRIDDRWHVFYQYNPHAPTHGDIHWGHMSSDDLLRWRTEPVAFGPRPGGPDASGCWSGTLIDDGGVPTAIYTAVDAEGTPSTVLARATDRSAQVFTRDEPAVAGVPRDTSLTDVRDPFLLSFGGRRWAVQGAGAHEGVGVVLLYSCDDLTQWTEVGTLLRADHSGLDSDARANIWECPSLVLVDGVWVLIVSIWRHVDGTHQLNHVSWITGDLQPSGDSLSFTPNASGRLDAGDAFYAAQALVVDDRVLLWGWSWETDHGSERLANAQWQGVLTYPRELAIQDGRVIAKPADELTGLRRREIAADALQGAFEVVADSGSLTLALDGVPCWSSDTEVSRVLVDGSLVEAFGEDGSLTTRAYPQAGAVWTVASTGGVRAYELGV